MLEVLTSLLNNHKLLRPQSLLPVCLHCSVNNPQKIWMGCKKQEGVAGVNLHPEPSSNGSFFLKFDVQGLGPVKTQ